jgi:tape measure domain-containing protein
MAVSNVELRVDARNAIQALQRVNRASRLADTATERLKKAVDSMSSAARKAGTQLQSFATRGLQQLRASALNAAKALSGLRGALLSLGATAVVGGMIRNAASAEQLQLRLRSLSKEYGESARLQQFVAQSAKTFGQSQVEAAQGVADVYARLRPLGISLSEIETVYKGFNAVALASGTSAEAASGAFLQLSQALGSGTLQGDEFRSVAEQVPGILRLVANEMGVTVGELKKLGSDGKITAGILINSLAKGFEESGDKVADLLAQSPAQRFKEFSNATQELSNALGSELLPALIPIVTAATELLKQFGALPGPVKTLIAAVVGLATAFVALAPAIAAVKSLLAAISVGGLIAAGPWVALAAGITAATVALASYRSEAQRLGAAARGGGAGDITAARNKLTSIEQEISLAQRARTEAKGPAKQRLSSQIARLRTQEAELRAGIAAGEAAAASTAGNGNGAAAAAAGGGGGRGAASKAAREAERAAEAAAREAARVQEVIRNRLAEGQVIRLNSEMQDRIAAAEAAGDMMLAARLKGAQRELDIQYRYAQELARETDLEAQKAIIFEGQTALVANQRDVQRELNDLQRQNAIERFNSLQKQLALQYEQNTAVQQQLQLADSVANTLGEGLASAFGALISGAQSWEQSLKSIASGVLIDIANQLIRIYIIEQAINAIRGFLSPQPLNTFGRGGSVINGVGNLGPNFGIPQRANGGSVSGGQPYLVGERGPELFMPGRSGGIAPTGSFGGGVNVVVNVDASGTSVQGDQSQGAALGRVVAAAVQAELIKQKRPGGLLTT